MPGLLILYSTVDGQTLRICERMKAVIEALGGKVELASIDDVRAASLTEFDQIVIGASIRYGKHRKAVFDFVAANRRLLDSTPSAFFSVNIVARKAEKARPETNPYVREFLGQTAWRPARVGVFAGRLDYPRYGFFDRQMIRLIMWITKGPTDPSTVVEYTDWNAVDTFARALHEMR
jgi:menaquinone-dependent protoporphyrinogen oxidase